MNEQTLIDECAELSEYSEFAAKAQAVWCRAHLKDKKALRVANDFFFGNPRAMGVAARDMGQYFTDEYTATLEEYLCMFAIGSVPGKNVRALLAAEWKSHTLSYAEVKERAEAIKQRPSKDKEPKVCKNCGAPI
jgi:hypothetical protein